MDFRLDNLKLGETATIAWINSLCQNNRDIDVVFSIKASEVLPQNATHRVGEWDTTTVYEAVEIGSGGGSTYTAGTNIQIIDDIISTTETLLIGGAVVDYDADRQMLHYTNIDGTTNDIGAELWFSEGKASEFIANGSPVQFAGVQGNHYLFKNAVPSEINENPTLLMGIATNDIQANAWGKVTHFGVVHDVNTNGWTPGTILWFDSVNGGLTPVEPVYPNAKIRLCSVIVGSNTVGSILVRPTIKQTDNNFTDEDKTKLDGIADGAEVNINADWSATTGDAEILNKPNTLNYKGHLSNVDSLPSTGQPSGLGLQPSVEFGISPIINTVSSYVQPVTHSNYFLFSVGDATNYIVQIETDYPEMVKIVAFDSGMSGFYANFTNRIGLHIDYDPAKPVYFRQSYYHMSYPVARFTNNNGIWSIIGDEEEHPTLTLLQAETIISRGGQYYSAGIINETNPSKALFISSNMSTIKFWYNSSFSYSGWSLKQSLKRSNNEAYYYTDGMKLFEQSSTPNQLQLVGNETIVKENDTYTVGDNYDIYVANSLPQWELWSAGGDAVNVKITNSGSYFTSEDVEGALQEIGLELDGVQEALDTILGGA